MDVELAKSQAGKPEEDDVELRKKLWLRIGISKTYYTPPFDGRSGVTNEEQPSVSSLSSLHSSCEHLQELISNLISFWLLPGL